MKPTHPPRRRPDEPAKIFTRRPATIEPSSDESEFALKPWTPKGGSLLVKTMQGLEQVLAGELRSLGAADVVELRRAVSFSGDLQWLYRANYELRTALRVLTPLHAFTALNEHQYYKAVRQIDWSRYLDVDATLAVDAVVRSETFRHSHFMALLTKDAIVDQFRDRFGRRPGVQVNSPSLRVHIHIHNNRCQLLIDSSDESLHLRGYRKDKVEAPISEVLAAGMILLSNWNGKGAFVDPMCGSGTLPIEAAMIARNIPPQRMRRTFGFMRWPGFDRNLWDRVKREADSRIQPFEFPILAADKENRARNATGINVMAAGLEDTIQVEKKSFEQLLPPAERGFLITNPPYDERLPLPEASAFYKAMGDRLKQQWTGWEAWIISANLEAMKHVGLRATKRIPLLNGALECSFQRFELYSGKLHAEQDATI